MEQQYVVITVTANCYYIIRLYSANSVTNHYAAGCAADAPSVVPFAYTVVCESFHNQRN